jgi:hypothetical protein
MFVDRSFVAIHHSLFLIQYSLRAKWVRTIIRLKSPI